MDIQTISFNLGTGIIGGATPMIATWLINSTKQSIVLAGLMVVAASLAILTIFWMRDRSREPLR